MSEQELDQLLAAMRKVRIEYTSSPEKARQLLREEGVLTENGEVADHYARAFRSAGT